MRDLTKLVEEHTAGDPMTSRKRTRRSLRHLSDDLHKQDHQACPNTVGRLLRDQDITPKANRKEESGPSHPDRDRQFVQINQKREAFAAAGLPAVSVDGKKKELVGNFKNPGVAWCRKAQRVNTYDFIQNAQCRATPYGVYDVNRNRGMVSVGTSADTGAFAADALRHWWRHEGRQAYPNADKLLILADGGGSNGHRPRLFKASLQHFADDSGLALTVCHYPTSASKWNPIEHRLFSQISINWAGKPLQTLDMMLSCIRGTVTRTGLRVRAWLNEKVYPKKVKVSNAEMASLNLERLAICPKWSYIIRPKASGP
ncbi:MAG TPA: ISAzo13 family transposase [Gammaproteobacteria bacterium]|nr:ISAzo13 family transposase [Gammaproteobacteria bacterium]